MAVQSLSTQLYSSYIVSYGLRLPKANRLFALSDINIPYMYLFLSKSPAYKAVLRDDDGEDLFVTY